MLRSQGLAREADEIVDAMECGRSGTEMLLRLRYQLANAIPRADAHTASAIALLVRRLSVKLDR